jgi:hypothetical protein
MFRYRLAPALDANDLNTYSNTPEEVPEAPIQIILDSQAYLLDSDRSIRHTVVTPPTLSATPPSSSSTLILPQIQECWRDRLIEGARGVEVGVLLGEGAIGQLQREGWSRGLELMEKKALERGNIIADAGVSQKVFSAGR